MDSTENFYKYEFVQADLLADSINLIKFTNLLTWVKENLWVKKEDPLYKKNALSFYRDKTLKRIEKFLDKYNLEDTSNIINGIYVPPIKELIDEIDFDYLIGKQPSGFHGDFILDNILIKDNNEFPTAM